MPDDANAAPFPLAADTDAAYTYQQRCYLAAHAADSAMQQAWEQRQQRQQEVSHA